MAVRQSKVLITDDSNPVHQLIRDALPNDYSTNIVHAFDGVECLQALDHGVDLAFIDVHMPTMGGMDALWAARIAGNKTFVTLISGRSNRRCIDLARQLDAYEFLTKPFGKEEIEAILATHRRVATPMHVLLVDDFSSLAESHAQGTVEFCFPPRHRRCKYRLRSAGAMQGGRI